LGQSIWMDFIRRGTISSGELKQLIEEDGLGGVTSNPSIFEKAIAGSHDYDDTIRELALEGRNVDQIYAALTVDDIQRTADLFRPVYDRVDGADGFVSLEVSPYLARDTAKTIADARRLWAAVARPNVMIKVPATLEGLPAIQQLIGEGINVNITLLFGLPRYRQVAEAYIAGLETRAAQGKPLKSVASVASFFLSRIDVLLDPTLEKAMALDKSKADLVTTFHGEVAIFSAKAAYQIYQEFFESERFGKLKAHGARTQRLLWASTSTKNPAYSDLKYVEALIGPETIDTIPLETLAAYRDHGKPAARLTHDAVKASETLRQLGEVGIDLDAITQHLEDEGIQKFVEAFDRLMHTLEQKRAAAVREPFDGGTVDRHPGNLAGATLTGKHR
jgi:transaldolase